MFIAHIWAPTTYVVRIDLKRSVSISSCALSFTAIFIARFSAAATNVVTIDLKRSVSIAMLIAHNWQTPLMFMFGEHFLIYLPIF